MIYLAPGLLTEIDRWVQTVNRRPDGEGISRSTLLRRWIARGLETDMRHLAQGSNQ